MTLCRLFIVIIFMFMCLCTYYFGSGSIITSPRDTYSGEERPRQLLHLFLRGKEDERPRRFLLLRVVWVAIPLVSSYSPFPLLLPTGSGFILTSPLSGVAEEVRAPLPPSPRNRRRRSVRRPSPLRHHRCRCPRFPCPPSFPTHTPCYHTR